MGFLQYVNNPISMIGLALVLFFSVHRALIKAGIIPPVDKKTGGLIVFAILRYGFWIAVAAIFAGAILYSMNIIGKIFEAGGKRTIESEVATIDTYEKGDKLLEFVVRNQGKIIYLNVKVVKPIWTEDDCGFAVWGQPMDDEQHPVNEPPNQENSVATQFCVEDPDTDLPAGSVADGKYVQRVSGNDAYMEGYFSVVGNLGGVAGVSSIGLKAMSRGDGHDRMSGAFGI